MTFDRTMPGTRRSWTRLVAAFLLGVGSLVLLVRLDSPGEAASTVSGVAVVEPADQVIEYAVDQAHAACFVDDPFPSAAKCRNCHPGQYREWSVSPHAYAQLSPVFNAMSNKLRKLTNGTLGDFCIRCHTPVGMSLDEPINMSNVDRPAVTREGVTCVVCHRINQAWGKMSGRQALVGGDLHTPVFGPLGGDILAQVIANPDRYGVLKTAQNPEMRGRDVHATSVRFFQLTTPGFCGSCHDVFAPNGFRLEDAFSEFKASPAAREKGQFCQDCHMGLVPGVAAGFAFAPAARVGNASTPPRKRTNHMLVGPDYSIIHPGIYPHNPKAVRDPGADPTEPGLATMREWLQFDYKSGWGTAEFEYAVPDGYTFPAAWQDKVRRFKAREILDDQFALLREATQARLQLLREGYRLGEIVPVRSDPGCVSFKIDVCNGIEGHGVPTGFDAERLVFVQTTVWDRDGHIVFQSGDLDPNGDVRDSHSVYVHNGELPVDRQLLSLQTRFVIRQIRGPEAEQVLNVPHSLDPLPYIRPETRPFTVLGRSLGARKHKQNIEVGGRRWAHYTVDGERLTGRPPYFAKVKLIAGMVPVNLVHEISDVGFDYGMSPRDVADGVVEGHLVLDERTAVLGAQ